MTSCLALDFGASGIRLIDVALEGERLAWTELARFPNGPQLIDGRLVWDYDTIFGQTKAALRAAGNSGVRYASIGAASWGVDYVLLGERGELLGAPVSYRDSRTNGQIEHYVAKHLSAQQLFSMTGIQCLSFNTLYQLYAQSRNEPDLLRRTRRLLLTADYVHYWLSGKAANERTLASTSQMLTLDGRWSPEILRTLALPADALAEPVRPGTVLGPIRAELETGLREIAVTAPAAHDTESAILAVPAVGDPDWAYLSSGTWSIIGVESKTPFCGAAAYAAGFSNECGYDNTYCVQSTVTGLWLIQEIQRLLGGSVEIGSLAAEAEKAPAFRSLVNPADARFFNPGNMIEEIRAACREAGEPEPESSAQLARCAYDSLALLYRAAMRELSAVTGRRFTRLHVVGGGSRATLLNRLCAATTGIPVYAGPAEATALGNALAQFHALGTLTSVAQARRLIHESFPPVLFEPVPLPGLENAIGRFERLKAPQ